MKTIELNFKEKLILFFASLTLIASASFLITFEKFQSTNNETLIPLGKVQSKHKLLKRKNIEGIVWEDLEDNKEVYLGDKIFTSDGSHAILQFGKNSFVEMSPLTLIQLKESSNRALQIKLEDGSLKAKLDKDDLQSLETKSGEIDINNSDTNIMIEQSKGTGSVIVLAGAVLLKNKSGQQELKENQTAEFTSNHISTPGKIDYIPLTPSSKYPTPISSLKSVDFKWKKIAKTQEQKIIEIAHDNEFKHIIKKIINDQDHENIDLSMLKQGTYFWRIKSISKKEGSHGSQKFIIFNDLPPQLKIPVEDFSQFLPINSNLNLEFQWEDISASHYQFETNFTQPESKESQYQKITNTNRIEIKIDRNGHFWWRVRGIFGAHAGPWSEKKFFKIHNQELPLKPINLSPANGIGIEPDTHKIQFKWKGAALYPYKFVLSKDESFKEVILEAVSKEGFYDWTTQITGQFFWKISSSQSGESSEVWNFSINNPIFKELSPINNQKLILKSKKHNVELKWSVLSKSGISLKGPRIVILYKDNKEIQRQETLNDQLNFEISEAGKYDWKIIYLNQQSEIFKFELIHLPALEAPKIKDELRSKIKKKKFSSFQLIDLRIGLLAQKSNVEFAQEPTLINFAEIKWDPIKDAKAYFLEIYQDNKGKELLISRKIKQNYYHWQGAPAGTYYFRVAYENNEEIKSPFSKLGRLIVEDIKDTDRFIELKYPKHKHTTFGERFGFEWNDVNQAEKYIVVIRDFQSKKLINKIETQTTSVMTTLNPGLYRWQVFGIENDIETALSEERYLKVADSKNSNFSKNDSRDSLIKNYFVIESLPGQVQSDSEVTRTSETYKNSDKLSLFPSSFRFTSMLKVQKDKFSTSSIEYRSGSTDNVNFLSQVIISGSLNWMKKIKESFVFYYGPSLRYDSISLVSEDNSANIGGSSLSYISTGLNIGLIQHLDHAKSFTHQLQLEKQFSFMTVQGQTMNIQYQMRKDKINFLRGYKNLYENLYTQIGLKYAIQTAKSSDDFLQLTSWELPLGIGFYID